MILDRKTWRDYKYQTEIIYLNSYYNNLEIEITIEIKDINRSNKKSKMLQGNTIYRNLILNRGTI